MIDTRNLILDKYYIIKTDIISYYLFPLATALNSRKQSYMEQYENKYIFMYLCNHIKTLIMLCVENSITETA